jgi:hypothetical protein
MLIEASHPLLLKSTEVPRRRPFGVGRTGSERLNERSLGKVQLHEIAQVGEERRVHVEQLQHEVAALAQREQRRATLCSRGGR